MALQVGEPTYSFDGGGMPMAAVEINGFPARIYRDQKRVLDPGVVWLGDAFDEVVPEIIWPGDPDDGRDPMVLRGFTDDPAVLAYALIGLVNAMVHKWLIEDCEGSLKRRSKTVLDVFLEGVGRRRELR